MSVTHKQTRTRQLQKIVTSTLKQSCAEYKLNNVAYIWIIRDFDKKSLPEGNWSGIIYGSEVYTMRHNCVIVFTTRKDQIDYADDCEVMSMWTNPNHEIISTKPRYKPYVAHSGPRKAVNKVLFEDVVEQFFELRDDPDVSIRQAAAEMEVSYSKFFKWHKKYEHYTKETFDTI